MDIHGMARLSVVLESCQFTAGASSQMKVLQRSLLLRLKDQYKLTELRITWVRCGFSTVSFVFFCKSTWTVAIEATSSGDGHDVQVKQISSGELATDETLWEKTLRL